MKYLNPIIIALVTIAIVSCAKNNKPTVEEIIATKDLPKLLEKRKEVVTEQERIAEQLKKIDHAIATIDTLKKRPLVSTFSIDTQNFMHYLELQGSVKTKQNIIITPQFSGILNKVTVKEGQKVSKGQLLAVIDDGGLSQQLSQLQIQAALSKTTFERQKRLWDQKIGSELQYLQSKASYEAQQKSIEQVKSQLEKTNIRAPFSGIIDEILTEQGSVVAPGQSPLMRIVNLRNMYIEAEVPENHLKNITVGKRVEVFFPVLGKSLVTKVRQVGHFINPNNRTFSIEVAVPNKEGLIKPNLSAKLKINDYTNPSALLIPQNIISENAEGEQYVYLIEEISNGTGIVKQTLIQTGRTKDDDIEVLDGLKINAQLIKEGARSVRNGQEVKFLIAN